MVPEAVCAESTVSTYLDQLGRIIDPTWSRFWLAIYDSVRALLGYSFEADSRAAGLLEELLLQAALERRYVSPSGICRLIRGREVCVLGASEDVYEKLPKCRGKPLLVADGVTELALEEGITPLAVFTDLDGRWSSIIEASRLGSVIVVHAHGDNEHALRAIVPRLRLVAGTVQAMPPRPLGLAAVLGGFTDGDRAAAVALYCGASRILLAGMRLGGRVSRYSKPWLNAAVRPWPEKKRKLGVAAKLLSLLYRIATVKGVEIRWL